MMQDNYSKNNDFHNEDDLNEIDVGVIARTLKREKFFILVPSVFFAFIAGLITIFERPVWRGNFKILVTNNETANPNPSNIGNLILGTGLPIKTQEYILKSPSVLNPVFKYVKNEQNKNNYTFEEWIKGPIDFKVEKGSNVIKVNYQDKNKDFIINVLNRIKSEFKQYSINDINTDLDRQIIFLEEQKNVYKEKSNKSLKEFNKFSIKNGLGDIDGFVTLGSKQNKGNIVIGGLKLSPTNRGGLANDIGNQSTSESGAGQRFGRQFRLLEQYETDYRTYSSFMKENSVLMKDLKSKIDNLKSSLKRPNEILIKYKELKKIADRDDSVLNNIESNLISFKLERIKDKKPWKVISEPIIEKNRISPQRKKTVAFSFLVTFLFTSIIALIKEKNSGIYYELNELKTKISCSFIESLESKNSKFNSILIKEVLKKNNSNIDSLVIVKGSNNSERNIIDLLFLNLKVQSCEIDLIPNLQNDKKIILLIEEGEITKKDIELINKYSKIYPDKFIGWVFLPH